MKQVTNINNNCVKTIGVTIDNGYNTKKITELTIIVNGKISI
jgi:hypothetical protein